jgi:DNA polymerase-3 subunit gamma/tau
MPTPGLARKVEEPGNADVLKAALREILGVEWTIRCDIGAVGSRETATGFGGATPDLDAPSEARGRGSTSMPSSAGVASGASARTPAAGRSTEPASRYDPPDDPDDDIPDDYEDARAGRSSGPVIDPEQAAIELLTAQLGARPLDPEA